jgi:lipopolysaccharide export system protein LptC
LSAVDQQFAGLISREMESRVQRSARRHSMLVRTLRFLFPAIGFLILAGMIGSVILFNVLGSFGAANLVLTSDGIVMDHPKLSGNDGDRSYQVTARKAVQRLTDPRIIDLEQISAEIVLGPDEGASIVSLKGIYNNAAESLRLYEGVQLEWSEGYSVEVDKVEIDLKTGAMSSDQPITIASDKGRLTSGKIDYDKDKGIVWFKEGVKLTLYPATKDKSQ